MAFLRECVSECGSMPLLAPPSHSHRPFFFAISSGSSLFSQEKWFYLYRKMSLDRLAWGILMCREQLFLLFYFSSFLLFLSFCSSPLTFVPPSLLVLCSFICLCISCPFIPLFSPSLHSCIRSHPSLTMCNKSPTNPDRVVLPTNVTPSHYTLTITPDLKEYTFGGYVEIK